MATRAGGVLEVQQASLKELHILPDGIGVTWSDGHHSFYNQRNLRAQCPCAHCVSEMTGQRLISLADIRRDVEAVDWMQVGRYAVQFLWSDSHSTGIYPYTLLRALCQCNECRKSPPG